MGFLGWFLCPRILQHVEAALESSLLQNRHQFPLYLKINSGIASNSCCMVRGLCLKVRHSNQCSVVESVWSEANTFESECIFLLSAYSYNSYLHDLSFQWVMFHAVCLNEKLLLCLLHAEMNSQVWQNMRAFSGSDACWSFAVFVD